MKIKESFVKFYKGLKAQYPQIMQFATFMLISIGMAILQIILMPILKALFSLTPLINIPLQFGAIGQSYFMFDYGVAKGGLANFIAVELTLAIATVINFFPQRTVSFHSRNNVWYDALWYTIAYFVITILAAALQGLYGTFIYNLLPTATAIADMIIMLLNCIISFCVYFPVFKIIFTPANVVAAKNAKKSVAAFKKVENLKLNNAPDVAIALALATAQKLQFKTNEMKRIAIKEEAETLIISAQTKLDGKTLLLESRKTKLNKLECELNLAQNSANQPKISKITTLVTCATADLQKAQSALAQAQAENTKAQELSKELLSQIEVIGVA